MNVQKNEVLEQNSGVSPWQRLVEARWLLLFVAVLFMFLANRYPDDIRLFVVGYLIMLAIVALVRRRPARNRSNRLSRPLPRRSIWPDTQVKLFVNAITEPTAILDGAGMVRHVNKSLRERFGEVVQGNPLTFKFRDPDFVDAISKTIESGEPGSVSISFKVPTESHYLIHITPIFLPRPMAAGQATNDALKREAGTSMERSADFIMVMMIDETERFRVEELRSDFIANVSHELRTPVASIAGFTETLLGAARDDADSRERFLKIMHEQTQRMSRLIDDLLSLSRIEMRSHLRPSGMVDLRDVVRHVVDVFTPIAEKAGLTIEILHEDQPFSVAGDHDELVQVVQNLVENACKYGSDGERVDVLIEETKPPRNFATDVERVYVLEVRDYGKGIAPEHLPRITERFYRVDADESKKKLGTGLGLAVVKHILMRHQAHMKVLSSPGEGARFQVYFEIL